MEVGMRADYEIKELNLTYKMSTILSMVMCIVGCGMLAADGWKEIFFGIFFILASFFLVGLAISHKRKLNVKLTNYLEMKLKEYFKSKKVLLRFILERKKKIKYSYVVYVNGYVNKEEFEIFMQNIKQELNMKMD